MLKSIFLHNLFLLLSFSVCSQDTFSIVALDPLTGEVGSAGASCVDLTVFPGFTDDFLGELFPAVGAINTQAWYLQSNQANARDRMNQGDSPSEIIDWLITNDVQGNPSLRQYGIVGFVNDVTESAAHTGVNTDDYKGHILGPTYSIQGNILLGQEILDNMEANFFNAEGDLACKLMAAMQGANVVGADTRCASNGTSSLFAFLKVAQPDDTFGDPSFLLSVRTSDGDGIEPIDSLQILFDEVRSCTAINLAEENRGKSFQVYPNPVKDYLIIDSDDNRNSSFQLALFGLEGRLVMEKESVMTNERIDFKGLTPGLYSLVLSDGSGSKKLFEIMIE